MTRDELKKWLPRASDDVLRLSAEAGSQGAANNRPRLRPLHPKPDERLPLDGGGTGEEACWHDAARRFEIVFIVHTMHPCDWDGYDIKALQDFCVKAGIIPDDGWKTLSGRVLSEKVSTQGEEKTVIEIRPV